MDIKYIRFSTLIIGFIFLSCIQKKESSRTAVRQTDSLAATIISNDKKEIQKLIRQVLNWANSKKSIDLLPVFADSNNRIYMGFDMKKHKSNLDKLRKTGYFSNEFIENYNQIILTLDRKLRNKEFDEWLVGDLPTFCFANDIDPWSLNQDITYDKPNPWDLLEVEVIHITSEKGKLVWKFGKPELNTFPGWKEYRYKFNVAKEDGMWKIVYLQGFDFNQSIRKD